MKLGIHVFEIKTVNYFISVFLELKNSEAYFRYIL